jgi:hypothetical protein
MAVDFRRGSAATQPVAPFLDRSMGILALGGGLIAVNYFTSEGRPLAGAIFRGTPPTLSQSQAAPASTKSVALQGLLLLILFVLAKLDEDAGSFGLTFVLALWGLWIYNTFLHGAVGSATLLQPPNASHYDSQQNHAP